MFECFHPLFLTLGNFERVNYKVFSRLNEGSILEILLISITVLTYDVMTKILAVF